MSVTIELFKENTHRETFISFIDKDYEHLKLTFKRPEEVADRKLAVNLPHMIFRNIAGLFHVYLDQMEADDKISQDNKRD